MLKRTFLFILAFVMCLSLAACGNNTDSGNADAVKEESTQEIGENEALETGSLAENEGISYDYEPERYETDTLSWDFDAASGTLAYFWAALNLMTGPPPRTG